MTIESTFDKYINNARERLWAKSKPYFPLWRERYYNPNVMDGDQYSMVRSYEKVESVIYGGNAYPITYIFVFNAINNVFD